MALASYIPRAVPLIFCKKKITSKFWQSFLFYMPYAVLSALTFPSIFYSTGNIYTALIGTGVALGLSFFKVNMALVAVICVAVVFGLGFVF
jgi:branched-subunit amino acid transport protein